MSHPTPDPAPVRHAAWVKGSHWIVTVSFLALAFSGIVILMCHPRLYWGEVGNDLTPALIELPISKNHRHGGWTNSVPFFQEATSPVSASRTFEIFNQNGWGRSLHFLAAWFLVLPGAVYFLAGIFTGHFWRRLVPRVAELTSRLFWEDVRRHLSLRIRPATGGPHYGLLQKLAYSAVIFLALPLAVVTGFAWNSMTARRGDDSKASCCDRSGLRQRFQKVFPPGGRVLDVG